MNWWKSLRGKIRFLEPLKNHTTFKIGGKAQFFIEPKDISDLRLLLKFGKRYRIPIYVIGKGSNILVSDKGIKGVVLRLSAPYFKRISLRDNHLEVGSGVLLSKVVLFARDYGLSGAEFLAGIPGTMGGALAMNSGISEKVQSQQCPIVHSIGDLVEKVTVMDYEGNIKAFNKKDIKFGYRKSSLSKYIILSALMKLRKQNKGQISAKIKSYLEHRKLTQDLFWPSAGCVFRNPKGDSAGRLIDLCGLKNKRMGDACISSKHANFILNLRRSRARDVLKLMDLVREKVKDRFNITLKPEIKIWQ